MAKHSDLDSLIELLLKTKEFERLASLVRFGQATRPVCFDRPQ